MGNHVAISALLSVYIGTDPNDLDRCLASLAGQTRMPDEVVVLYDGPVQDGIDTVVLHYQSILKIRHFRFAKNRGLGPALNDGVGICRGKYIARVDTDDVSLPSRLQTQLDFLDNHPHVWVVGGILEENYLWGSGARIRLRRLPGNEDDLMRYAKTRNPLNHQTVMMRREKVLSVGNYIGFPWFEDYHLWVRIMVSGGKLSNINEVLASTSVARGYFVRRGGWEYSKSEISLANYFRSIGFLTLPEVVMFLVLRIPPRIMPNRVRTWLYFQCLRSR